MSSSSIGGTGVHTRARDTRDARYDWLFLAEVVRNDDPLGIGRIKVLVPGLLAPESQWAMPIGMMLGIKNGIFWVPEVGSNACVFLLQGHPNHPYYLPGPYGKPGGTSDAPEQAPEGSVDHMVIRWRDFHMTLNGTKDSERFTIEDLGSGTKIEIDRASGDYIRTIEGNETVEVAKDKSVTVEGAETVEVTKNLTVTVKEGDEVHQVQTGKRTTTIQGDDVRTVVQGNTSDTVSAGSSTEAIPAGSKTVTAGVNVSLAAGVNLALSAAAAASLVGASVAINSSGPTTQTSTGIVTKTLLGGVVENVTGPFTQTVIGVFAQTITGIASWTVAGVANLLAAVINLGVGPIYKPVLNSDMIAAFNAHIHTDSLAGATSGPTIPITPGGSAPFKREDMESVNVKVS